MKTPIEELMDEHQVILRMVGVLRGICLRLEEGEVVAPDDLTAALDFIRNFADACHHAKEEDLLFPAMEEAGIPSQGGPVAVMLREHQQGRQFVRAFGAATERLKDSEPGAARDFIVAARGYADLLENHIYKEDNILYPMALSAVAEDRWLELRAGFTRVEAERMGPRRGDYLALVERLAAAYPDQPAQTPQ